MKDLILGMLKSKKGNIKMKALAAYPIKNEEGKVDWSHVETLIDTDRDILTNLCANSPKEDVHDECIKYLNSLHDELVYEIDEAMTWITVYNYTCEEIKKKKQILMRENMEFNHASIFMSEDPIEIPIEFYWYYPRIGMMKVVANNGKSYMCTPDKILLVHIPEKSEQE